VTLDTLSQQLIELYDKISSWEQSVVKDTELTPTQMHAVETLGHCSEVRMKELAQRLGITTGTLTVTVDKLEKKGLVTRIQNSEDRRSWRVALTEAGASLFRQHHRFHVEFTRDILQEISPQEQQEFSRILGIVLKHM